MWPFSAPNGRLRYFLANGKQPAQVGWAEFARYRNEDLLSDGPHYDERRFFWITIVSEAYGILRSGEGVYARTPLLSRWEP